MEIQRYQNIPIRKKSLEMSQEPENPRKNLKWRIVGESPALGMQIFPSIFVNGGTMPKQFAKIHTTGGKRRKMATIEVFNLGVVTLFLFTFHYSGAALKSTLKLVNCSNRMLTLSWAPCCRLHSLCWLCWTSPTRAMRKVFHFISVYPSTVSIIPIALIRFWLMIKKLTSSNWLRQWTSRFESMNRSADELTDSNHQIDWNWWLDRYHTIYLCTLS